MAKNKKNKMMSYNIGGTIGAGFAGALGGAAGTVPLIGGALQQGIYGLHGAIDPSLSDDEITARGFGQAIGGITAGAATGNVAGAINQGSSGVTEGLRRGTDIDPRLLSGFNSAAQIGTGFIGQGKMQYGGEVKDPNKKPAKGINDVRREKPALGESRISYKQILVGYTTDPKTGATVPKYELQASRLRDSYNYGGNIYASGGPVYEAEGGEVIEGGQPQAFQGGQVSPNSSNAGMIEGNSHGNGGVKMSGGKRIYSDSLFLDEDFINSLDL